LRPLRLKAFITGYLFRFPELKFGFVELKFRGQKKENSLFFKQFLYFFHTHRV
jgi:hypothetical protein